MRWVRLRGPRHPLSGRLRHRGRQHGAGPRRGRARRIQREQAIHLARICLLGELSAALVHELNQPLAAILANARAGRRRVAAQPGVRAALTAILDDIVQASQRAISVIQRMRALFLRRGTLRQPVDLNAVARDAVALARACLAEHGVRLTLALDPRAVPLRADAVQLQQVLLNLILNACDALDANPPGARNIAIATAGGPGPRACLTVTDNGTGIAGARPERIFDSFFTTKPQGLGVGLAVAREIVAAHGGRIEAANRAGGGAVFRVTLPLAGERHDE
jgi:C4-dicarboxylate-specific signal transduction histidine kinase